MKINIINNELKMTDYAPFYKDIVCMAIIGQTLLIAYVVGVFVYFA